MVGGPSEVYASSRAAVFLCGDEPAFTQGFAKGLLARCFFRKTTSASLNLKFFSKINPSFFTIKEGSTSHLGLLPLRGKEETALLVAFFENLPVLPSP